MLAHSATHSPLARDLYQPTSISNQRKEKIDLLVAADMPVIYLHCVVTMFVPKIVQDCNYDIRRKQSILQSHFYFLSHSSDEIW